MSSIPLALALTPHGHLVLTENIDAPRLDAASAQRLKNAFERGSGHGLLQLGAGEVGTPLPPVFSYWREFGARYVTALCTRPEIEAQREKVRVPRRPTRSWTGWCWRAPPMTGAEYLTAAVLGALWQELDAAFRSRTGRIRMRSTGFSEAPEPGVEPGRPRALQSRRKPQRSGCAVRFSRHLHHAAVGAGQGAASAAGPGAARICGRGQQGPPLVAARFPCSARRRLARG